MRVLDVVHTMKRIGRRERGYELLKGLVNAAIRLLQELRIRPL